MQQPFEAIVDEHGPTVLRVCRALLGPHDANDAWSETFLSALRAYPDLRSDRNLRGWLVTIAHRKAIDQLRRRSRSPVPVGAAPAETGDRSGDPSGDASGASSGAVDGWAAGDPALTDALGQLPFKQRGAVAYRYLADLSYADIAALLECSEAAARRSASDGIARLRITYTPDADTAGDNR